MSEWAPELELPNQSCDGVASRAVKGKKVNSYIARNPPEENLLPLVVGYKLSAICSKAAELAQY